MQHLYGKMKSVPWRYFCFLISFPETILEHVQFPLQQGAVFIIQPFMLTWIYLAIHTLAVFKGHQEKWLHDILMTWHDMIDYALSRAKRHQTMTFCRRCKSPRQLGSLCLRWRHWDPIFGDWGFHSALCVLRSQTVSYEGVEHAKKVVHLLMLSSVHVCFSNFPTQSWLQNWDQHGFIPSYAGNTGPFAKGKAEVEGASSSVRFWKICNIFLR